MTPSADEHRNSMHPRQLLRRRCIVTFLSQEECSSISSASRLHLMTDLGIQANNQIREQYLRRCIKNASGKLFLETMRLAR